MDFGKPGSGSTTIGITAKRAFQKTKTLSKNPIKLIVILKTLMDALNSGWDADPLKYDAKA